MPETRFTPNGLPFTLANDAKARVSSILNAAKELKLDWKTVKELEKEYLWEKLNQAGEMKPKVIGSAEISPFRISVKLRIIW